MRTRGVLSERRITLADVIVLVILLLLVAVLGVPHFCSASGKALCMYCMSKARTIANVPRTYASNWDGWTHPDPTYYVKEFGYRLTSEPGYFEGEFPWYVPDAKTPTKSQVYASKVKDFRCPQDPAPALRAHGISSSYQVMPVFAGGNIMNLGQSAPTTLVVAEVGERHPSEDVSRQGHYVYADLHATLGYKGPPLWK